MRNKKHCIKLRDTLKHSVTKKISGSCLYSMHSAFCEQTAMHATNYHKLGSSNFDTLVKFKNKCLLLLTLGVPPQTLHLGFWKQVPLPLESIHQSQQNLSERPQFMNHRLYKKHVNNCDFITLSSMAFISFPQASHWSPLASWKK